MEYDNTNTGVLFRNETSTPENKQPTHTGKLNVGGKDFQLAGWMRESSKSGRKFLSLKIQEPHPQSVSPTADSNTTATDIPF